MHNLVATPWMNGDVEQALSCVGEIRKLIGGPNTRVQERQTDLMEAVLRNQRGETSTAQGLLKKALEARVPYLWDVLHTPNGIIAHACALAFETGIAVENARELTRRFRLSAPSHKLSDWPWPIRIRALGRFSIEKGDAPLSCGRKTPRRPFDVIKALIVFGGEEVKIERIADAVWPELDGHAANAAFHTALYRLRKILGNDDVVRLQDGKLTLNRDQCWVDSMALLDECKSIVASALEHAEIERVAARLCRLYQGNFLMLEADVPWTRAARERLRKAFQETMGRLAQRLESLGLVQEAAALQVRRGATDVSATVA